MKKPLVWAERLGHKMTVRTAHYRHTGAVHAGETSRDAVERMGYRVVGAFTTDVLVPSRSTALVVAK